MISIGAVVFALLLVLFPPEGHADPLSPPPAGSWAAFPNSTLRPAMTAVPCSSSTDPTGHCPPWNPLYIFDYSGGWFDDERNELGVWGGGHGDYPGNEVCTFPLATGVWTCGPRSPYPYAASNPGPAQTLDTLADGNPGARHTYSCLARVNIPGYDGFFCHGGALWQGGYPVNSTWFFHRDTLKWEKLPPRPLWGDSDYGASSVATYAVFDKLRNTVLVRGRNMCLSFDMRTKTWAWQGGCEWSERTASAAYDPERQTLIVIGAGKFEAWNTATTAWTPLTPALSGDLAPVAAWGPGFVFDPVGKRFLAYIGGKDLYELNRETWTFTKIAGAGADPGAQYPVGTHGRFRYVSSTNGLVVVNSVDGNVFYYQLGGTPLVTPPPPPPPTPLAAPPAPQPSDPPPPSPTLSSMSTMTVTIGVPACAIATPPCLTIDVKQTVMP
jgi:hypothetical protein